MHRRNHKKSKNGCLGCKRRHIKCDETHPSCVNCLTANAPCSYQNPQTRGHETSNTARSEPPRLSPSRSPVSNIINTSDGNISSPNPSPNFPSSGQPYVNLLHLELLQHFMVDNGDLFLDSESAEKIWPKVVKYAQSAPFLMYEVLSISALHLSLSKPELQAKYLEESSKLQAESLRLYNESVREISSENVLPAFLFSALTGIHLFCETFRHPGYDLNHFLDRLVQSVALLRGVRIVISGQWEQVLNSDIAPLVYMGDGAANANDAIVVQINKLYDVVKGSANLTANQVGFCNEAIKQLIWAYTTYFNPERADGKQHAAMVTSWPATVSAEYVELLSDRKPEALIILIYYAVLAHLCRGSWAVGNSGRYLLSALEVYLGVGWDDLMIWPRSVIYGPTR
ncbi:hypothetical protein PVAG01_04788 [Phlyctema vagabunda]|uniref:Zn(2)-C6 fungal-type domain-containing protein n=1 Tax=Phlyctema vagabunda TaxID=108571 RepID=A0ABR4PI78_9HELO